MDRNISILIYEKEKHLNSILYQQISDTTEFEPYSVNTHENFIFTNFHKGNSYG